MMSVLQDILVKVASAISLVMGDLLYSRARRPNPVIKCRYPLWSTELLGHVNKDFLFKETFLFGNNQVKTLQIKGADQVLDNLWLYPLIINNHHQDHASVILGKAQGQRGEQYHRYDLSLFRT